MNPILYVTQNPRFAIFLSGIVAALKKKGNVQETIALMIWLHTTRASLRPELHDLALIMWGELIRGFPFVEESVFRISLLYGYKIDTHGSSQFPLGFAPIPL